MAEPETNLKDVLEIDEAKSGFSDFGSNEEDFTIYVPAGKMSLVKKPEFDDKGKEKPLKSSIDATIEITRTNGTVIKGRALAASCHEGAWYSITVRRDKPSSVFKGDDKKSDELKHPVKDPTEWGKALNAFGVSDDDASQAPGETPGEYLYQFDAAIKALSAVIFGDKERKIESGLLVIAGTTGSGKSNITRGLIQDYLLGVDWKGNKRRPHLVTVEDPIEAKARDVAPGAKRNHQEGWDYTPRLMGRGKDVGNIRQALRDAKRMKPALVYIGETREAKDWQEVVDFAGSGHLIVTTTHASSLVETVQRIFRAVDALTPAGRGAAAQSILAAIHLESLQTYIDGKPVSSVVPAVWKRTTNSSLGLVSDGLASILPGNPPSHQVRDEGSLGRHWFVNKIRESFLDIIKSKELTAPQTQWWDQMAEYAATRDLVSL